MEMHCPFYNEIYDDIKDVLDLPTVEVLAMAFFFQVIYLFDRANMTIPNLRDDDQASSHYLQKEKCNILWMTRILVQ